MAAIPVWGWVAAAALALGGILGKKRGGPKTGGSFSTTGERLFTPDSADAEAGQLGQSALSGIADLAKQLGGTATGLSLGIGFDSDPQGTAGNRISSFLRDASGRTIFDNIVGRDVGRDDAALQVGLGDETSKLILAGLKASDLPTAVRDYLGTIDVATFTAAKLDSVIAGAKALLPSEPTPEQSLLDKALQDPGTYTAVSTEVRDLVEVQRTAYTELQRQGEDRRAIASSIAAANTRMIELTEKLAAMAERSESALRTWSARPTAVS